MSETKKAAAGLEDFKRAQSAPVFSPVMCQELPGIGLEITIEQDAGSMVQVPIPQPTCKMQGPSSTGSPKISNANTYKMCRWCYTPKACDFLRAEALADINHCFLHHIGPVYWGDWTGWPAMPDGSKAHTKHPPTVSSGDMFGTKFSLSSCSRSFRKACSSPLLCCEASSAHCLRHLEKPLEQVAGPGVLPPWGACSAAFSTLLPAACSDAQRPGSSRTLMPSAMFGRKPRAVFQAIYSDNANKVRVTGGCLCFCDDLSDP